MHRAPLLLVGCAVCLACRSAPASTSPEVAADTAAPTTTAVGAPPAATPAPRDCPPTLGQAEALAAFDEGRALLDASREGDHFLAEKMDAAFEQLRSAALAGHLGAQSLLGSTSFGVMFTNDAPQPAEREAYIEAVAFLRTAAIGGDPAALAFMEGLTSAVPATEQMPLSDLPTDWVLEAWQRADAWLACNGMPWR